MKKLQLMTSALLAITLCSGCNSTFATSSQSQAPNVSSIVPQKVSFTDIQGHWAKDSIERAVVKGYVEGYENGTFRPDLNVTRAEFIKMVIIALNKKDSGVPLPALPSPPLPSAS